MKVTTMSMLSLVCLMGVILGIHANGYGGGAYSYYPVSPGYYGGGGGGGWGNGGFLALIGFLFIFLLVFSGNNNNSSLFSRRSSTVSFVSG